MRSLTELGLTYEDTRQFLRGHICACGGQLVLATRPAKGDNPPHHLVSEYVVKCGTDPEHGSYRAIGSSTLRGGTFQPMESRALEAMSPKAMMARIDQARFPQALAPAEKQLLATVAISYGLDPLMGELSIYQGRPYVGIDGRLRKAQETGRFAGIESRPATSQERDAWQIPDEDYFFRCEVYVKGIDRPFVGWGRVFERETHGKGFKPTETNPQRMAEKRAEAQALRKAFHIPLPSSEDIGSPAEPMEPIGTVRVACRVVDSETGEVSVTAPQPTAAASSLPGEGTATPATESAPEGKGEPLRLDTLIAENDAAQDAARQWAAMPSAALPSEDIEALRQRVEEGAALLGKMDQVVAKKPLAQFTAAECRSTIKWLNLQAAKGGAK